MSRRAVLWVAFALVHVGVAWLGFVMPNNPTGDVYLVYAPWSRRALEGTVIVGISVPWVYPQLALLPMIAAQALAPVIGYPLAWVIVITAADAVAFAVLIGRAHSVGRTTAAWFWLTFIAVLGPVGVYRLDGFTTAVAILGCLWLVGRPWLASILLAVAVWTKVWPVALLAAAVIAVRRRAALLGGAVVVSALTLLTVVAAGGARNAFGFVGDQTSRGLQVEAPVSTPYLWGTLFDSRAFRVSYERDMLTFQVTGPDVDAVIAVMTPLLLIATTAVAALGVAAAIRGARYATLFPPLSLALVLGLVVFNKVGSPQYLCWLVPSLVTGLVIDRRRWTLPAALALGTALLTQVVYPVMYSGILAPALVPVAILTVRNLALIALFAWMVARLVGVVRVPSRAGRVPASVPAAAT
ncbi:glycosyltransferase 87 family protein [Microbacterium sp.]|uniref:glycosyltransferase 87 family protein n=1 Tax=Microbacterium sp. TaxID=51671 RepID=UPI003C72C2DE